MALSVPKSNYAGLEAIGELDDEAVDRIATAIGQASAAASLERLVAGILSQRARLPGSPDPH
jgi:hypothetical protein